MDVIANLLTTLFNLGLVMVGFGFIIFVHELGHFLAAKWARVRVLAFALGFGPAIASYRKGMGLRRGSSEREYIELVRRSPERAGALSPTEYRLNWLPLGGYVKMLGQEDLNPSAVSAAPDSYGMVHPLKRMVIISAGVVMNILLAGVMFMVVFMVGLERQPPLVGALVPGGAAATAVAVNGEGLAPSDAVLKPGDRVVLLDGRAPTTFDDLILSAAMGTRTSPIALSVERPGLDRRLDFQIVPKPGMFDGLLDFGIEPYRSNEVMATATEQQREEFEQAMVRLGLAGVRPGSRLVSAAGEPVASAHDLTRIVNASGGQPIELVFEGGLGADGEEATGAVRVQMQPVAELQTDVIEGGKNSVMAIEHLLGLWPVMMVESAPEDSRGYKEGLRTGDVFERIGSVEFPTLEQGMLEIQAHKGRDIDLVLRRPVAAQGAPDEDVQRDAHERVVVSASVGRDGRIGFVPGTVAEQDTIVGLPPAKVTPMRAGATAHATAAERIILRPGVRVAAVDGTAVGTFTQLREALRASTAAAAAGNEGATVRVSLERLMADGSAPREDVEWALTAAEVGALHALAWEPSFPLAMFELESFELRASGPIEALKTGVGETHRVMMSTYLTLLRLFQGTVRVEHLKGPVGITHMGTLIAERGVVWLLFFFALVSVNLAVINFLPLPIVDGGQFLMLVYEWIRGKPVPMGLQNAMTLAGLVLIGSVFVIVTFNDVAKLIGG